MSDVLFHGVRAGSTAGHYFYKPESRYELRADRTGLPITLLYPSPDGRWCHPLPRLSIATVGEQVQGRGFIHYAHGWTIVAWWDRSGDSRMNSNAVFFVRGRHLWAEALRRAEERFPAEFVRMRRAYTIERAGSDLLAEGA